MPFETFHLREADGRFRITFKAFLRKGKNAGPLDEIVNPER